MKFIDLDQQYQAYKEEIDAAIHGVLDSGQFILGSTVGALEETLAAFVGSRSAIGVASGTDGLLLALMAHDVAPGDEILTTPFTFIATAEVISLLRARPVFVDIDPVTYNMDTGHLKAVLAARLKAGARVRGILPVSLYGQCADMEEINAIAAEAGLFVVEDACQSFGAEYKGRRSCALSEIGVTSFFPSKPLGCYGDGGMVFTDNPDLDARLRMLRVHGQDRRYHHAVVGINGRLDAIQAAVVLAKFGHFERECLARQEAARAYDRLIGERVPGVQPPQILADRNSVYAQYTVRIPHGLRDGVAKAMRDDGIPTAVHYPMPLHLQPAFADLQVPEGSLPRAEEAAGEVLSLPMHPFLTPEEQETIVKALGRAFEALVVRPPL